MLSFELAFKYRNPVVIVGDGYLGQMTGKVQLPREMVKPGIPEWAVFGDRSHRGNLICSLDLSEVGLEQHNVRLNEKYERMTAGEQLADLYRCDDAEILLVACNTPAQLAKGAIKELRDEGLKVGLFRPVTLWPFPIEALRILLERVKRLVVVEASSGQLEDELRLALSHAGCPCAATNEPCPSHGWDPPVAGRDRRARAFPGGGALMSTSVFYSQFERHADGQGINAHSTTYCPGCGHGLAQKYLAQAIDELEVQDRTVLVSPVGCSVFSYYYFDVGNTQAPHGRAPAVAIGHKTVNPDSIVICYQGDGDLASIGLAEIVSTAQLGIPITVIFINNAIYGMTGGQMAPTTLIGQRTTTTPKGRTLLTGQPMKMAELISVLDGPVYVERVALYDNRRRTDAKRSIKKALELQVAGTGFAFIEVLSECPVDLGLEPKSPKTG